MSWRFLLVFSVLMLLGSAAAGVALGNWLVDQAPRLTADPRTNVTRAPEMVLDARGRPLVAIAPQPRLDGTLGEPHQQLPAMWELQPISLFETNLDPMVVLARGDEAFTVADMLSQAGSGLVQGEADVAMVDLTAELQVPAIDTPVELAAGGGAVAPEPEVPLEQRPWREQLTQAIEACNELGFFSRPGCIESARKRFCAPNQAWGRDSLCPSPGGVTN
jgi:hypothetical protein